ncbi:AEC family transporter [Metabacillus litoralis]|uniref:AEC family transporter n=1 Tax=Metabacillus litoralis TaxID=152268 RepID=UPI0020421FB0|nr:AEC family transporter [Metabacillus litoralis]
MIILIGLLLGIVFKWVESNKRIKNVNRIFRFSTKLVLFVINPIIFIGVFWTINIDNPKLALLPILGAFCIILGGIFAIIFSKFLKLDNKKKGSMFVSGSFTNLGSFGTIFCFSFLGETSLVYVALFRLFEDFIYYTIGYPVARSYAKTQHAKEKFLHIILRLAKDPFIIVAILGITVGGTLSFSSIERPEFYSILIGIFVPMATLLLMIPIGYHIKMEAIRKYIKESFSISFIKFILVPVCIISLAYLVGMGELENGLVLKVILILSVMPPAFVSVIPTQIYELDIDLANSSIILNSGLLIIILPIINFIINIT